MNIRRPPAVARNAALYAAQALIVGAIAYGVLKLRSYDLRVPFNYEGDSIVILMYVKGLLLNGWNFVIPQLSAPFGLNAAAFPIMTSLDWLIMKTIGLFTREPGLVLNLFWLLTLVFSAATATVALRLLGLGRVYAFSAGLLYAFLPFALMRNVAHLNLVYYLVPLLGLLAVHLAAGLPAENDRLIRRVAYAACVGQGFDYVYYSFFAVLVFAFAAAVGFVATRSRRVLAVALTAIALISAATALNLAPGMYSWYSAGKPPEMAYKGPAEAEIYGAKIRRMVAPNARNPVHLLARWGTSDQANGYPNENENITARLGLAAAAGFVLLLLISMGVLRVPESAVVLGRLAPLSLFTLIFITVGGAGALFNLFFFSDIRAYNRFSVFLAFFSLAGLGFALRAWMPRSARWRRPAQAALALLFVLGLYDQLLDCYLPGRAAGDAQQYRADRDIAAHVQALYPAGASVLQLPLTGFPLASRHGRMISYDHLRPFLWSGPNLHWSWPSFSLRHRAWQDKLAAAPPASTVDAAVYSEFDAILVDRYGYADDAEALVAAFEAAGAVQRFGNPRYVVLDLHAARLSLLARLGQDGFARKREEWLEPVRFAWGAGFYETETTADGGRFRWSSRSSRLTVFNDAPVPKKIRLDFDVAAQGTGSVEVQSASRQWHLDVEGPHRHASLEVELGPASQTTLAFRGEVPRVAAPGDPRDMYFNVANFGYTELGPEPRAGTAVAGIRERRQ